MSHILIVKRMDLALYKINILLLLLLLILWVRRWLISPMLACSTLPHSGHGYVGPAEALVVVSHTIEHVKATAGSLFKCPFPALANRVGANRR